MNGEPLSSLASGQRYRFADWPNPEVPNWRAGVYTVWDGDSFMYVGMAGRNMASDAHLHPEVEATTVKGIRDRLDAHANGRRSGDQFCVYVCDRLVLPTLSQSEIA